jgi:hypothetical protein
VRWSIQVNICRVERTGKASGAYIGAKRRASAPPQDEKPRERESDIQNKK